MTRNRFLLLGAIVPGPFGLVMMVAPEMILSNHLVALGAIVLWLPCFRLTIGEGSRHNLMARITTIDAKRSRQHR